MRSRVMEGEAMADMEFELARKRYADAKTS
jgi:hypothetical protein